MDALRVEFGKLRHDSVGAKIGLGLSAVRSSGPLFSESKDITSKQFDHYWKTGVTFDDPDKVAKVNNVNPTFIYSAMKILPPTDRTLSYLSTSRELSLQLATRSQIMVFLCLWSRPGRCRRMPCF